MVRTIVELCCAQHHFPGNQPVAIRTANPSSSRVQKSVYAIYLNYRILYTDQYCVKSYRICRLYADLSLLSE